MGTGKGAGRDAGRGASRDSGTDTAAIAIALAITMAIPGRAAAQTLDQPQTQPQTHTPIEIDMTIFAGRNPLLVTDDDAVTGGVEVGLRAGKDWQLSPGTKLGAEGNVAFRQYSRRYGNFVTGRAALALDHRHNEYLSFQSEASFERVLPAEATADSIDSAIDPLTLQNNYALRQTVTWNPNALSTISGQLGWRQLDPQGSSLLERTTAVDLSLNARRQIDALTTLGLLGMMTWSRSRAGGDPRAWSAYFTAERRIVHAWRLQAQVGVTRTSQLDTLGARQSGGIQFAGNASLCHDPGRISACVTASIQPVVSAYNGIQRETAYGATFSWRSSPRGTLTASADYRRSPQPAPSPAIDTMRIAARYDFRLNQQTTLFAGPEYRRRTNVSGQTVDSTVFRIGVTIGLPRP
ncbi:hypothetical protein WBP07_32525 [Novosphingobium sp. BL-8A]|uniref:hypothetical protein n=1 Tax=Novosphingobium sp. BL-8A TaxID=3127639 RepID=UPI00375653E4